jgi:hypothetical protein
MRQIRYILINGTKRQEAVGGRALSGPNIVDFGNPVGIHVFPDQGIVLLSGGYAEGVVL